MTRRLFLTGPMGCGKSTAIEKALGERIIRCGGFRTRRQRDIEGHAVSFFLESPDRKEQAIFLDVSSGKPEIRMEVFSQLGTRLLEGRVLVLDEIGGIELLCPEFMAQLERVLRNDTPILGVMKGPGPAGALITALNLCEEYHVRSESLRQWMLSDPETTLYECSQFDEKALILAKNWVEEYLHA